MKPVEHGTIHFYANQRLILQALGRNRVHRSGHDEAEQRLKEWQAISAEAQRINEVGVWQHDLETGVIIWSDQVYRLLGLAPNAIQPTFAAVQSMIHPDERPEFLARHQRAIQFGERLDAEHRVNTPDGRVRHFHLRGEMVHLSGKSSPRLLGVVQDITERKQAQILINAQAEKLREMQTELIFLYRQSAMATMAATLAHELNQPLTAISNYSSGLMRLVEPGEGDDALIKGLEAITANALRAGEIIRRMRNTAQKGETRKEPVCLEELIQETVRYLEHLCNGISIEFDLEERRTVLGDRIQIQQVLINLMRNACEALAHKERRVLRITTADAGDLVKICVWDTGPGITSTRLDKLFEGTLSSKPDGMGIGLSICRTLVEAHGGAIGAENTAEGACFWFTIPQAVETGESIVEES